MKVVPDQDLMKGIKVRKEKILEILKMKITIIKGIIIIIIKIIIKEEINIPP